MPLTYRGNEYELTPTEGLDWVEVKGVSHRGIPYKSYQLASTNTAQQSIRRVYRGVAY